MGADVFANIILILHTLFVLCVVVPVPLICIGARRGWGWVRDFRLRVAHLSMMAVVAAESVVGMVCPLTTLEDALRERADKLGYGGGFIETWLRRLIYVSVEPSIPPVAYLLVLGLTLAPWWILPPGRTPN